MLAVVTFMVAAGIAGVATVDVIRAYANGGTHYAIGHLSAVGGLRRFARTGAEEDFFRYRQRIHPPISDRIAREILEDPELDASQSYPFLIAGRNHPRDVAGLAWFFRLTQNVPPFVHAIDTWREADATLERLDGLADRLYAVVRGEPDDMEARIELVRSINELDARLIQLEDRFATELGAAARTVAGVLYASLAGCGLVLALLILGLGYRTHRRLLRAYRSIRDREQRFRDVAEMTADWFWETDAELRYSYMSDRMEKVIGVPAGYCLGRTRLDLATGVDPQARHAHLDDLAARRPFRGFEYRFLHPSGVERHFRINGKPRFAEDGQFLGYRGTGTDITEEATSRQLAEENNTLLGATFESMIQGICVVDSQLRILAFNRRFLVLLDLPSGRFMPGEPVETIIRYAAERGEYGPGDIDVIIANKIADMQQSQPRVIERVRPNGVVLELRVLPMPDGGAVFTYNDVTERRRAARDLQDAKLAAETASNAKSAFLANMSHELRTPLNAVIGFSDLIAEERFGPISDRYAGYARDIRQSGQHLLAVINDILDISRIEAGKMDLMIEPVDAHALVDSCLRLLMPRATDAGVLLRNDVQRGMPALPADRQRLSQIVINLVGNAVKFSDPGTEVVVRYVSSGHGNGLSIVDQGIGMAPDEIDRAFEPFGQLNAGNHRKHEGTGLGLPLVRRFMDLHGGTVSMRSRVGQGTTVTVLFPLAASPPAARDGRTATIAGQL
jgi:PAS domain S-box-containing protein